MKKINREIVTDGVNAAARLSLGTDATVKDAHALLMVVSRPKETLAEEIERRSRELEEQSIGIPEPSLLAVQQQIAEARSMLKAVGAGAAAFTSAQLREPLERARWLVFQGNAAPLIEKARKFKPNGRGPGPVRKAIERLLKKQPSMKNAELWQALKTRPPKGYTVCENRQGRYIEGPTPRDRSNNRPEMTEARFRNICAEVRKELKSL